jgi:hypothetical protein
MLVLRAAWFICASLCTPARFRHPSRSSRSTAEPLDTAAEFLGIEVFPLRRKELPSAPPPSCPATVEFIDTMTGRAAGIFPTSGGPDR